MTDQPDDIVERLRTRARHACSPTPPTDVVMMKEAAAEISRLREALTEISASTWMPNDEFANYKLRWEWVTGLAREALGEVAP